MVSATLTIESNDVNHCHLIYGQFQGKSPNSKIAIHCMPETTNLIKSKFEDQAGIIALKQMQHMADGRHLENRYDSPPTMVRFG